jgi:hypothetical protein
MKPIAKSLFVASLLILTLPVVSQAAKHASNGRVVHTRLAPVIVHRISPPYLGNHVFEKRSSRQR